MAAPRGSTCVLLREAEYFLTPRVAELYRLEELMPSLPARSVPRSPRCSSISTTLAGAAHRHRRGRGERRIAFPRTGEPRAEMGVEAGALRLGLAAPPGGRASGRGPRGWSVLPIARPADYSAARGWIQDAARELLIGPR